MAPKKKSIPAKVAEPPELHVLPKILGERLRNRRTELGYSLEKLAQLSQVSRGMLGLIEAGRTTASLQIFWKLSLALRCPLSDLLPEPSHHKVRIYRKEESFPLRTGKWDVRTVTPDLDGFSTKEVSIPPGKWPRPEFSDETGKQTLFLNSGRIQCKFQGEWIDLGPGDSVFFLGKDLEEIQNPQTETASLLWTCFPPRKS